MSWKGELVLHSAHWRVQRVRCWFRAMLAHFDNVLAAALEDVIVRAAGLRACQAKRRVVRG
ncbi:MAG TPA: hypothetical protein VMT20_19485 [Terriglobia bacterium]|nr:hypothetical protein [Terriglobia bacterium]